MSFIGSTPAKTTATVFPIALMIALLACDACGAPMRPLPDEVSPIPRTAMATLGDAGAIHHEEAGVLTALGRHDHTEKCAIRVRWNGTDHAVVSRGLTGALRDLRAAGVSEDLDQSGAVRGLRLDTLEEGSCLGALGFQEQDVLLEINGYALGPLITRRQAYESVDDGDTVFAVIHFMRGGKTLDWRFDESH